MANPLPNLFGAGNPIGAWVDPRRNQLAGFAAGMLSGNPGDAFRYSMAGAQTDAALAEQQRQLDEQAKSRNATMEYLARDFPDLAQAVEGGVPLSDAWGEAWRRRQPGYGQSQLTANQRDFQFAKENGFDGNFQEWVNGSGKGVEFGTTPIWGQRPDGTYGYGVQGKDGSFHAVDTGDLTPLDPRSLAGEKSAGSIDGKTQAMAQANLPDAELAAQQTLEVVDKLMNDQQGLEETFGKIAGVWPQQWAGAMPGTAKANYGALIDQAKGKIFLQAYNSLRGGGQITEVEGAKAEQALARLNTAQSKEAFLSALSDFKQAVRDGLTKLRYAANGGNSTLPMSGGAGRGQVLTFNPETGQLE